jgi:alpha-ketoglutarate-dependent taurine dioxygenase
MYEIYDRLSPSMAAYLETLTAIHDAKFFHEEAERLGNPLRTTPRGSPLNHGSALGAVHPVIRTNRTYLAKLFLEGLADLKPAVTGWKGVFVNRGFTRRIQGVTKDESDVLLQYLFNVSVHKSLLCYATIC